MAPDKILQAYVCRAQMSCVKILAPGAKGAQNGGEKVVISVTGYNELVFLCNGTPRHEILTKT